jgi:hypothetical protein
MTKPILFILTAFLFTSVFEAEACTTAVISGKCTPDGRPLLYKQRDTDELHNILEFFKDGKYEYVGLVNSNDKTHAVWGGYNTAGFAIINSASYNLNGNDPAELKDREGLIMKLALQQCATVEDFARLLDSLPKPMGAEANFGVIDAKGGAAYFETGNSRYTRFDANDANVAPMGYLIRTNFSYSGDRDHDKGISRYAAEEHLFANASLNRALSCDFLLRDVSRCLTHGITGINLYDLMPQNNDKPLFVPFRDFIPRYITSAAVVVQGIKADEPVSLTTLWAILGSPLTSIAVPVWINDKGYFPMDLLADDKGYAPLCEWALNLKKQLFPITRGEGADYLNLSALINKNGTGILQKNLKAEQEIVQRSTKTLNGWREKGIDYDEMADLYRWIDRYLSEQYKQ